jgi:type I restriction enzyme, S subunit
VKEVAYKRLEEVATIERDGIAATDILRGTMYVGLEHIDSDGYLVGVRSVDAGELASNKFRFGPDHILYGKLRPYLRKTARPDIEGICSTDIVPIRPGPEVERDYLFHFLRHPKIVEQAVLRCSGANLPRLSPRDLAAFEVPLPPLSEQRRIADILDKADAIRRKRKEAIALTEELLRAAFLEMFGDPVTNPKGWTVKTLDQLDVDFSYGTSTKCTDNSDGRAVLRIPNVVGGEINYSDLKYAKFDEGDAQRFSLVQGDIVFVRSNGNPNYIARGAVFRDAKPMLFASYLIRARLPERCPVLPEFVHFVFSSPSFREQLLKEATTTAGNYNINTKGLGRQRMPLPPMEAQKRFMSVVAHARVTRRRQELYSSVADNLFNALVSRAFSGDLTL